MKLLGNFFAVFFYTFCYVCLYAQAHGIGDSIQTALKQKQLPDSTKLRLYLLLAEEIRQQKPYQALDYTQISIDLAIKTHRYKELTEGLIIRGIIYDQQGNYSFALDYFLEALEVAEKKKLLTQKPRIEKWIAIVYSHQKNYQQAIDFANKSLQSAESLRDRQMVASSLSNIALLYLDKKDYVKAIYYFDKSIKILKTIHEKQQLADTKINLLNVYLATQNYPKALELCKEATKIYKEIDWKRGENLALINFGEIYAAMDSMPQSLDYFRKALTLAEEIDDVQHQVAILNYISQLYLDHQKLTDAELYAEKSLAVAKRINAKTYMKESYEKLYRIYKTKGIHTKALFYYELERQITDSIYNYERDKLLMNMHKNYETEKHLIEINSLKENQENLTQEVEKQTLLRNTFLGGFVVLCGLFFFLWHNTKEKRKINQELKDKQAQLLAQSVSFKAINQQLLDKKSEIEELNNDLEKRIDERTNELSVIVEKLMYQKKEADEFANIVSHNLASPIKSLKGLVNLAKITDYNNNIDELNQFIEHTDATVQKLDIVVTDLNQILAIKESISKIYELIDLKEIVTHTLKTRLFREIENSGAIIKTNFTENLYFLAIHHYIENIVYQLLSNAIKYKDPEKPLIIEIVTCEISNNEVCLSVKDNGLGVPNLDKLFQLHQRQHLHVEGTGLGLYLVATQIKAMNGRVDAISSRGRGAEFLVYFKRT
jgi:signal transduction histidine kinase